MVGKRPRINGITEPKKTLLERLLEKGFSKKEILDAQNSTSAKARKVISGNPELTEENQKFAEGVGKAIEKFKQGEE